MANWVQKTAAGSKYWSSTALSTDGSKIVAAEAYVAGSVAGYLYTSTDSGVTWTRRDAAGQRVWTTISCSPDGSKIYATDANGVYYSGDYGTTWTTTALPAGDWRGVALSQDGVRVIAVKYNGGVYTSADSGATWTVQAGAGTHNWTSVCCSTNGATVLATDRGPNGTTNGNLYVSTDYGVTWVARYPVSDWRYSAMSGDGTRMWATYSTTPYIYYSTDRGVNWTYSSTLGGHNWNGIAVSTDGKIVTLHNGDGSTHLVKRSTDYGSTWTDIADPAGSFPTSQLSVSPDGMSIVLNPKSDAGYLYSMSFLLYPAQTWKNMFLGSTQVQALYLGSKQIWAKP